MASGLLVLDSKSHDPARAALQRIIALCGAVMRGVVGLVAGVAALLGAVPPVSSAWLGAALALNLAWTGLFVWVALRHGLRVWLVTGEIVVTGAFCLAQGHLVVAEVARGGASWIAVLVTMTILVTAIAWPPRAAVPAGLVLASAHFAGSHFAAFDGGVLTAGIHLVQITATSALMTLLRRSATLADAVLQGLRNAETASAVLRARRADERSQYSRVHDTALNTLTMTAAGGVETSTRVLRDQAAADLAELERIAASAVPPGGLVSLDGRLRAIAARTDLRVKAELTRHTVPRDVAEAFSGAAAEALTNVVRHAGVPTARLRSADGDGEVLVEIIDGGPGFDLDLVPPGRYGLSRSIVERMESAGGGARIESDAAGTRVVLWWRP
jgi:signal transduction histidine kinase